MYGFLLVFFTGTHDFLLISIVTIGLSRTVSEINADFRQK